MSMKEFQNPSSVFVTSSGSIYIDGGDGGDVVKISDLTKKDRSTALRVRTACFGLSVDTNNTIYCSIKRTASSDHKITQL